MNLKWLIFGLLHTLPALCMEQDTLKKVSFENLLSIDLKYTTILQERGRFLIHGNSCGNLNPQQQLLLNLDPESKNPAGGALPIKFYVTAVHGKTTMTKRYIIEEYCHYLFVPDEKEVFVIKKRAHGQQK